MTFGTFGLNVLTSGFHVRRIDQLSSQNFCLSNTTLVFKVGLHKKIRIKNCQKSFNTLPKWRNVAKSGHTVRTQFSHTALTYFPAAADVEGDRLLDGRPAFDALLHDGGAALAGDHVQARLEQHRGCGLGTDETVLDLKMSIWR